MRIKDKTNPIICVIEEHVKSINKLLKQKKIKAKVTSANNDYNRIEYYLSYTGVICSKKIIENIDDISICLGGKKVGFAPVVDGFKGSLITEYKTQKDIEIEQGIR